MRTSLKSALVSIFFVFLLIAPEISSAKSLVIEGWVPYWKKTDGTAEVLANLRKIWVVSPFSFEVNSDGSLKDTLKISQEPWPEFIAEAKADKTKIVPSIAWTDGDAMQAVLSSSTARAAHEKNILDLITSSTYDGVDINYENKKAETNTYFSQFLKELAAQLHKNKKTLTCSIEARTPASSRFQVIPKDLAYANDFKKIGTYCDEVRLLAYDQGRIDYKLNQSKGKNSPYLPVADTDWVKKVVTEAINGGIPKSKLILGIPTYGYEYQIDRTSSTVTYSKVRSLNYNDFIGLQESYGDAKRNAAGEMTLTYTQGTSTRQISMSDAGAIMSKVKLAKQLGLKGISLFKLDGGTDPLLWKSL